MNLEKLEKLMIGEPAYRLKQIRKVIFKDLVEDWKEATVLPKILREKLQAEIPLEIEAEEFTSKDKKTVKARIRLADGSWTETVLMKHTDRRNTVCVSCQVGCPLGCEFCETGKNGFRRNLSEGEIVEQVLCFARLLKKHDEKVTNVVFMGMGEPMLNYDNVMKSVEIITTGMGIAAKHITVSTVGLPPQIRRMADENRKMKLAISLHSLDQGVREKLMPVAKKYKFSEIIDSLQYYYRKMKRRPTFEYILFERINDREEDLKDLIKLSKQIPCKVNIIPFHDIGSLHPTGIDLRPAKASRIEEFVKKLRESHVTVFIRSSAGEDIDAACGQLAVKTDSKPHTSHLISV